MCNSVTVWTPVAEKEDARLALAGAGTFSSSRLTATRSAPSTSAGPTGPTASSSTAATSRTSAWSAGLEFDDDHPELFDVLVVVET